MATVAERLFIFDKEGNVVCERMTPINMKSVQVGAKSCGVLPISLRHHFRPAH